MIYNIVMLLFFVTILGTFVAPDFFETVWLVLSAVFLVFLTSFHTIEHMKRKRA